jgi:hypothetical protein
MSSWSSRAALAIGICGTLSPAACSDDEERSLTPAEAACLAYCGRLSRAARELGCDDASSASCFAECAADASRCSLERLSDLAECVVALPDTAFVCLGAGDPAIVSTDCDEDGVFYERSCANGSGGGGDGGNGGNAGQGASGESGHTGTAAGGASGHGGSSAGAGGDGMVECTGSVAPCASLATAELCTATLGCRIASACQGQAEACEERNGSGPCQAQLGCTWSGGCSGAPNPCASFTGEAPCSAQTGCTWTAACLGNATPCGEIHGDACSAQPGCSAR